MMTRWAATFALVSAGMIGLGFLAFWAANGFADWGLDVQGAIALVVGAILLAALGVGLMALMFYSDRSGRDDEVRDIKPTKED